MRTNDVGMDAENLDGEIYKFDLLLFETMKIFTGTQVIVITISCGPMALLLPCVPIDTCTFLVVTKRGDPHTATSFVDFT